MINRVFAIVNKDGSSHRVFFITQKYPILPMAWGPPPRSVVVRASARGAGGRGSIPDRVTPKM